MGRRHVGRWAWRLLAASFGLLLNVAATGGVLAHEAPDEGAAAYVMADWMLLSFMVFAGVALIAFVVAIRRGLMRDLEQAKYHVLEIDEEDYYTPDWAKEDDDASKR